MSSSIPIIICGKIPGHQKVVIEALKPEYEILGGSTIPRVELFAEKFPSFFESSSKKPVAIFMGGGFDRQEFETAYAIPGASSLPWLRPIRTKPGNEDTAASAGNGPPAEKVAAGARNALEIHAEEIRDGKGANQIWYY